MWTTLHHLTWHQYPRSDEKKFFSAWDLSRWGKSPLASPWCYVVFTVIAFMSSTGTVAESVSESCYWKIMAVFKGYSSSSSEEWTTCLRLFISVTMFDLHKPNFQLNWCLVRQTLTATAYCTKNLFTSLCICVSQGNLSFMEEWQKTCFK